MASAWVRSDVIERIEHEADRAYPNETGGILIGYFSTQGPVVTDTVGPGPDAVSGRTAFVPDNQYQYRRLAEIYENSGRSHTYLGDWHTHPGGVGTLSRLDRKTLRRIARTPAARAPEPIMVILAGCKIQWQLALFQLLLRQCGWVRYRKLASLRPEIYEDRG